MFQSESTATSLSKIGTIYKVAIEISSITPEPTPAQRKLIEAAIVEAWPTPATPQRREASLWQFSRRTWGT